MTRLNTALTLGVTALMATSPVLAGERTRGSAPPPTTTPQPVGSLVLYDWFTSLGIDVVFDTNPDLGYELPSFDPGDDPVYLPSGHPAGPIRQALQAAVTGSEARRP